MFYLLLMTAEVLSVFLPFLLAFSCIWRQDGRRGRKMTGEHLFFSVAFGAYLAGAFYITGCGTLYDILYFGLEWRPEQINLIPFSGEIDRVAYILNVFLFMPMGFLVPALTGVRKAGTVLWQALVAGGAVSLLIELSQLLNNRRTDVDDLILNTMGALIGGILYLLFRRLWTGQRRSWPRWQPVVYLGVAFLGHFFFYNEYGLVRLLW